MGGLAMGSSFRTREAFVQTLRQNLPEYNYGGNMGRLKPGAEGKFSILVDRTHLASSMGNSGVNVLATPVLAFMFEGAATVALAPAMREGEISVGTMILVRHLRPTPPGMTVTAEVRLRESSGRKYLFDAVVFDDLEKVAEGSIERAIIDKDRFERTLAEKVTPEIRG